MTNCEASHAQVCGAHLGSKLSGLVCFGTQLTANGWKASHTTSSESCCTMLTCDPFLCSTFVDSRTIQPEDPARHSGAPCLYVRGKAR